MIVDNYVTTGSLRTTIQLQLAIWVQPQCWYGPQWKWVWHPCPRGFID